MFEKTTMPEADKSGKEKIKPFLKKIESGRDFDCKCGKEIKKGDEVWMVLTQEDIEEVEEGDPKPKPSVMCKDCLDDKLADENERREIN
jgi:hypothetical protein